MRIISSFILCISSFSCLYSGEVIYTAVTRVIDGDTIEIRKDGEFAKVRLYGIDAPEKEQQYGRKATDKLIELLKPVNIIKIKIIDKDRYGRYIASLHLRDDDMVYVESNLCHRGDVGLILVDQGLAWHYKRYSKSKELKAAEIYARSNKLGLWNEKNPIAPWDYRKLKISE